MKLSMDEFRGLASRYADLYQSSFDADSSTLRNVELYPSGQRQALEREQIKTPLPVLTGMKDVPSLLD